MKPSLASLFQAVELRQEVPPLLIGERANANGSARFRSLLQAGDYDGCLRVGLDQEHAGAHVLDLCAAFAGRDETRDMIELVSRFARSARAPLMIDSTSPATIEACLKIYPGRCIVNSVNLEDGGETLRRVLALVRRYGAAVVALTIHETGMAMTVAEKLATARRLLDIAVGEIGLRPSDVLIDPLTFTVGSGDPALRDAAAQTLEAIRRIKTDLPGVHTLLGISNVSFGLAPGARRVLNSVFLHEAVEAGLDAAIVDAGKILPLASIPERAREAALDLIYNRTDASGRSPLERFIDLHAHSTPSAADSPGKPDAASPEQALFNCVVTGTREGLADEMAILLRRHPPVAIINQILVPAMRRVGEQFGRGETLLPFVLQSAEIMKAAVTLLEPHMDRAAAVKPVRILLATVRGDVHDIGKNLVDILLTNNGYRVYNLGIQVTAETILEKAREHHVDLIGLSGLLVKSALMMAEMLSQFEAAGLRVPVLLGGAALTRRFVAETCVPRYGAPVVYCPDAFAGLQAVQDLEAGRLRPTPLDARPPAPEAAAPAHRPEPIPHPEPPSPPPFLGVRYVSSIDLEAVLACVNEEALFRGRWGYRRGGMSADAYAALVASKVRPLYESLKQRLREERLADLKVAYGWFPCWRDGDLVHVRDGDRVHTLAFPRQAMPPHRCVADFFRTEADGGDVAGLFVATIGEVLGRRAREMLDGNRYHDYLLLHGLGAELADALAEHWHAVMRRERGVPEGAARGARYGFGYAACPGLDAHRAVFAMLRPESIGVTLTESLQMTPELSTSALVTLHPQAAYFAV